jgi:hypothetical protein
MEIVRPPHDADYRARIEDSMDRRTGGETTRPPRGNVQGNDTTEPEMVETVEEGPRETLASPPPFVEDWPTESLDVDDDADRVLAEVDSSEVPAIPVGDAAPVEPDDGDEAPGEGTAGDLAGAEIAVTTTEAGRAEETPRIESAAPTVPAVSAAPPQTEDAPAPVPPATTEETAPTATAPAASAESSAEESAPAVPAARATRQPLATESSSRAVGHPAPLNGDPGGSHMTRRLTTRLGQLLLDAGLLSVEQLEAALDRQQETGERLGALLVAEGYLGESDLLATLEKQYGVPAAQLEDFTPDPELIKLVPYEMARRNLVVPLKLHADSVDVAMVDPTDFVTMAHLRFATGVRPNVFITTVATALHFLDKMYGEEGETRHGEEPPIDRRAAIKQMILDRDAVLLSADQDPRKLYGLAISIEAFVDEILRKADGGE